MTTYDEFNVDYNVAADDGRVVGVIVRDASDGEVIFNLPIQGGLTPEKEANVMTLIKSLLTLCLGGSIEAVKPGDSN